MSRVTAGQASDARVGAASRTRRFRQGGVEPRLRDRGAKSRSHPAQTLVIAYCPLYSGEGYFPRLRVRKDTGGFGDLTCLGWFSRIRSRVHDGYVICGSFWLVPCHASDTAWEGGTKCHA
jgi:hypothetical protein